MSSMFEDVRPVGIESGTGSASPVRYVFVDVWRGLAIIGVVIYHFGWDLNFFGFTPASFMFSWPVTVFARALAGSFMFLAGVSLVLAHSREGHWPKFLRRLGKLFAAATAISVVTYLLFPEGFIYFGVLHAIAVASVLGLPFLRLPISLVILSSLAIFAAPLFFEAPAFDTRILAWVGFASDPPMANDFVPVFPWFGVTLAGIVCTRLFLAQQGVRDTMPPHGRRSRSQRSDMGGPTNAAHLPASPACPFCRLRRLLPPCCGIAEKERRQHFGRRSPEWRCSEPSVSLASPDAGWGSRSRVRRRRCDQQSRGSLDGGSHPRAGAAARAQDARGRDPQGGLGQNALKKRTWLTQSQPKGGFR